MLESLKEQVYEANLELVKQNLVIYTWGNVSGFDKESKLIVIKPSGVEYDKMKPDDMVIVDLNGNIIEGNLKPSSDTPTHIELYKNFKNIGSVVHTHSTWATQWAQAGRNIPAYGTTHADYFHGEIPCSRELTKDEIESNYETNTGKVIIETFKNINEIDIPGIVCKGHGPFTWGKDCKEAVHNAKVLEQISMMAHYTEQINKDVTPIENYLLDKHYFRKHGKNAYYGQ